MKAVLFGLCVLVIAVSAHADCSISITNESEYAAKFTVIYEQNGRRSESKTSEDIQPGAERSIEIPDEAKNVYVKCDHYWQTGSIKRMFIVPVSVEQGSKKCFKIMGTAINPMYESISC